MLAGVDFPKCKDIEPQRARRALYTQFWRLFALSVSLVRTGLAEDGQLVSLTIGNSVELESELALQVNDIRK